jgi:hypothetical protein
MDSVVDDDPILVRRARIAHAVAIGKRIGYAALLVAIVGFFAGLALDFPSWSVIALVGGLVTACVVLPLPIVFGYGVRAAAREDGTGPARH